MLDAFLAYGNRDGVFEENQADIREDREPYWTYKPAEPVGPAEAVTPGTPGTPVERAPAFVTLLGPCRPWRGGASPAAFKIHRRSLRPGETIETEGYGKAKWFKPWYHDLQSIEDLLPILEDAQDLNVLLIRGRLPAIYTERGVVCERRKCDTGGSISDGCNRLVVIDIDSEPLPDDIDDPYDLTAVGDSIRAKLPPPFNETSCIVQASAGYGMWEYGKPRVAKVHLFFILQDGLDESTWRAWIKQQNKTGRYPLMDASVAGCVQPIYIARPRFEDGLRDPVPQRLALLYGEQDEADLALTAADLEALKPAPLPTVAMGTTGAAGRGEQATAPGLLAHLARRLENEAVGEGNRHSAILAIGHLAGGYAASGAFGFERAVAALVPIALATGSAGADRAVLDALKSGMNKPLAVPELRRNREGDADSEDDDHEEPDARLRDKHGNLLPTKPAPLPQPPATMVPISEMGNTLRPILHEYFASAQENAQRKPRHRRPWKAHLVDAPVGSGKSELLLAIARALKAKTHIFAPTLALCDELVGRVQSAQPPKARIFDADYYESTTIRGKLAPRPGAPEGIKMCDRPKLIQQFRESGLVGSEESLFCQLRDENGEVVKECPHFKTCAYQRQFAEHLACQPHANIPLPRPRVMGSFVPAVTGIDESPLDSLTYRRSVKVPAVLAEGDQLGGWAAIEIAERLAARESMRTIAPDTLADPYRLISLGLWMKSIPARPSVVIDPETPDHDSERAMALATRQADPRCVLAPLSIALPLALNGKPDVLTFIGEHLAPTRRDANGRPAVIPAALKIAFVRPPIVHGDLLCLDATASPAVYQAVFGDDLDITRIAAEQPKNPIVQVIDSTFSMKQLANPSLRTRLVAWLHGLPYRKIGLISHKEFLKARRPSSPQKRRHAQFWRPAGHRFHAGLRLLGGHRSNRTPRSSDPG